jgi:hypothetical protein
MRNLIIVPSTKYYQGDQMGKASSTHVRMTDDCKIILGKPEKGKCAGRPRHTWKIILKLI